MPLRNKSLSTSWQKSRLQSSQNFGAGLILIFIGCFAISLTWDLHQGVLASIGPALFPRWIAAALVCCGLCLALMGFTRRGEGIQGSKFRGPVAVLAGVLAFALTIRPFSVAGISSPGLGLIFAGPLSVFISGYATPEVRTRDLIILALFLTSFSIMLFGDLLNLPIPIFSPSVGYLFPADWPHKTTMRVVAATAAAVGLLILALSRSHSRADAP